MYYKQSLGILGQIRQAKNILVNVHKNPDLDSIGTASALYRLINQWKKKVTIVACEPIEESLMIFPETKKIKVIDYANFNFSSYDLFLVVDSSSHDRVTGSKKIPLPKISLIAVDHHHFNSIKAEIKLIDTQAAATCEIIYKILKDEKIPITKDMATRLYSGMVGDSVFFKYMEKPEKALAIASELLKIGADHQYIIDQVYDNMDFKFVKLMGVFLEKMKIEKTNLDKKFVWAAVPHKLFIEFGAVKGAREAAADSFFRSIKGVDFGLAMVESKPEVINISFRSKPKTDVSVMAKSLGGGGHTNAAGATVEGEFNKATKNTLAKIKSSY